MKTDKEWANALALALVNVATGSQLETDLLKQYIRLIQADALKHAVGVLQEGQRMYPGTFTGVVLKNVAINIEHKAEEIDGK